MLLDNDRIFAKCCGCDEYIFGDMRLDPVTNSVLVVSTLNAIQPGHQRETGAPVWTTLVTFAEQAATTLLRTRRFRARRQRTGHACMAPNGTFL